MNDALAQALADFLWLPPEEQRERMLLVERRFAEHGDPDDPSAQRRAAWALHHRAAAGDPDPRLAPYRKPPQRTARRRRSANPRGRPTAGQARYDDQGHYIANTRNTVWTEVSRTEAMALALVLARRRGYGMSAAERDQREHTLRDKYCNQGLEAEMSREELERQRAALKELHCKSAYEAAADILFAATGQRVRASQCSGASRVVPASSGTLNSRAGRPPSSSPVKILVSLSLVAFEPVCSRNANFLRAPMAP